MSAEFEYKVNITKCMNLLGTLLTGDLEKEMEEKTRKQLIEAAENAKKCGGKVSIPNLPKRNEEERIVLYTQILTVEQTKVLAENMKSINSNGATVIEWGIGIALGTLLPEMAGIIGVGSLASAITRANISDEDVLDAAKNDKRIKMIVTDSKNNHTSYSVQIKFKIMN